MNARRQVSVSRNPEIVKTGILDAAQAEFMAEGYAGASTNRIVERFGRSKPTVFRHFPTKRALFEGVVARIAARWAEQVDWRGIPTDVPAEWLRSFATRALQWVMSDDTIFVSRMAVASGHEFPEVVDTFRGLAVEPIQRVIAGRLRAWTKEGLLECHEPKRDAEGFLDLTISGLVSRRLYGVPDLSPSEVRRHMEHRVAIFLRGMEARQATRR